MPPTSSATTKRLVGKRAPSPANWHAPILPRRTSTFRCSTRSDDSSIRSRCFGWTRRAPCTELGAKADLLNPALGHSDADARPRGGQSWEHFHGRDVAPMANAEVCQMDWNRVEGNWKQVKGRVKEKWGQLTDDDLDVINGRRDQLEGKIQQRYGLAKDQARKDVDDWFAAQRF